MSFIGWICIGAWVAAFLLQCVRLAIKHDPGRERLYRTLTVATFAAVSVGIVLQAAMGIAGGGMAHVRAALLGVVILALLAAVS